MRGWWWGWEREEPREQTAEARAGVSEDLWKPSAGACGGRRAGKRREERKEDVTVNAMKEGMLVMVL